MTPASWAIKNSPSSHGPKRRILKEVKPCPLTLSPVQLCHLIPRGETGPARSVRMCCRQVTDACGGAKLLCDRRADAYMARMHISWSVAAMFHVLRTLTACA